MNRKLIMALGLTIIAAAALIVTVNTLFFNSSSPSINVRIEPENISKLSLGSTFAVNITAEKCANMNGVQVDVRFNPQVLNITNNGIVEGALLESANAMVAPPRIRSLDGTDTPLASLIFQAGFNNLTGNGVLFSINFEVISSGSTKIQLYPYQLGNTTVGTYFLTENLTSLQTNDIIAQLRDASYGMS